MAASVARHHQLEQQQQQQPAGAATSMMARVERLDLVLGYLEEMMQQQHRRISSRSTTATSSPSTPAAAAAAGGGGLMMMMSDNDSSSAASTPRGSKSWRRASCRPAKEALEEAQAKGTLVDRIAFLEDRVLKMEEDMDIVTPEKMTTMSGYGGHDATHRSSSSKKKGLKSFVKSCVRGKLKTKD